MTDQDQGNQDDGEALAKAKAAAKEVLRQRRRDYAKAVLAHRQAAGAAAVPAHYRPKGGDPELVCRADVLVRKLLELVPDGESNVALDRKHLKALLDLRERADGIRKQARDKFNLPATGEQPSTP